jgi:hypothetical protein
LRVEPVGGVGNVFYDILNACLIARSMGCTALAVPDIEGGSHHLPVTVDGIHIEPTGVSGTSRPTLAGAFYWPNGFEPLLQNYNAEFLLDTIERFTRPVFGKLLNAAGDLGDHVLAIHFRGGDIFLPGGTHSWYVQPPASFYLKAIKFAMAELGVTAVHLVFQDRTNPSVDVVSRYLRMRGIPVTLQSSSVFEDMVTLLSARHVVAAYGTFCESIAMLSERVKTYTGFRTLSTQTAISFWAEARVEDVLQAKGVRMFVVDDPDQSYIEPATWANTPEQIEMMRTFPDEKLQILERLAPSEPL